MVEVFMVFVWYLLKFCGFIMIAAGGIILGKACRKQNGLCGESVLYGKLHDIYRSGRECTRQQFRSCCLVTAECGYEEISFLISLLKGARSAGMICVGVTALLIGFLSYCAGIVFRFNPAVCLICVVLLAAVIALFFKNAQDCMEYEYLLNILEEERRRKA